MNMTCEHVDAVLSAWLEGDLGGDERRAVDVHLRECLRCASLVRDIQNIRLDASKLLIRRVPDTPAWRFAQ